MELNKYLVLDVCPSTDQITVKVVRGFTKNEVKEVYDIKDAWTPLGGGKDKLFFFSGCAVPRFKVREKYACTIKPSNATAAFMSKESLEGSSSTFDYYRDVAFISLDEIIWWIDDLKQSHIAPMVKSILANDDVKLCATNRLWWDNGSRGEFTRDRYRSFGNDLKLTRHTRRNGNGKAERQLFAWNNKSNLNAMTCDVYDESAVLKYLNEGNLVVDAEKYIELQSFGDTEEKENLVLMMEIMSNADYSQSIVYLLLLLDQYGKKIADLKEVDHVNFKSLLSFLDLDKHDLPKNVNIHKMTSILRKHKKFTRQNAMLLSHHNIGKSFKEEDATNEGWVLAPVLSPDSEHILNT